MKTNKAAFILFAFTILFSCKSKEEQERESLNKLIEVARVQNEVCKAIQDQLIFKAKNNLPADGFKEKLDSCNRISDSLNDKVYQLTMKEPK